MKSKAPLILMEQMVMLLVFALAAALCLQAFVKSDAISQRSEARDRAATAAQTAAEAIRHTGDIEAALSQIHGEVYEQDGVYYSFFDKDWNYICSIPGCGTGRPAALYRLEVRAVDSGVDGLGKARVEAVVIEDNSVIFSLDVAWQTDSLSQTVEVPQSTEVREKAEALCREVSETLLQFGWDEGVSSALWSTAEQLGYHFDKGILYQEFDEAWNLVDFGVYALDAEGIPADVQTVGVCVMKGYNVGQELEVLFDLQVTLPEEVSSHAG